MKPIDTSMSSWGTNILSLNPNNATMYHINFRMLCIHVDKLVKLYKHNKRCSKINLKRNETSDLRYILTRDLMHRYKKCFKGITLVKRKTHFKLMNKELVACEN